MAQEALRQNLELYNNTIDNNFKNNWGSLLSYLDGNDTALLTKKANFAQAEDMGRRRI